MKKRNQSNMVERGIGAEASRDGVSEGLLEEVALSQDLGGEQEPVWEDRGWGIWQWEQQVLRVPGRHEGAWHAPGRPCRGRGQMCKHPVPQASRSRRSWNSVMCAKASVGGLLKNRCAGMICHRSNMILFITFSK